MLLQAKPKWGPGLPRWRPRPSALADIESPPSQPTQALAMPMETLATGSTAPVDLAPAMSSTGTAPGLTSDDRLSDTVSVDFSCFDSSGSDLAFGCDSDHEEEPDTDEQIESEGEALLTEEGIHCLIEDNGQTRQGNTIDI